MVSYLQLITKADIPFVEATLTIHQPTLKEISYIGEESFYTGCNLLNFNKERILSEQDNFNLADRTNFEILMSIMINNDDINMRKTCNNVLMLLTLIFPNYSFSLTPTAIIFKQDEQEVGQINNNNFEIFKQIIIEMFCLNQKNKDNPEYNPQSALAKKIADKLKKGQEKVAQIKNESKEVNIISRYISILAVGEQKDINSFSQYTVYQLFDEFQRFTLYLNYDLYMRAKLAGAKDLKDIDDWMGDIHS